MLYHCMHGNVSLNLVLNHGLLLCTLLHNCVCMFEFIHEICAAADSEH